MALTRRAFLGISAAAAGLAAAKSSGLDGLVGNLSEQKQKPRMHALLIYPRNTASIFADVYKFLMEQDVRQEDIEPLYLLGPKTEWQVQSYLPNAKIRDGATKRGLYNASERLKRKVSLQDTLFIYFQHHGVLDKDINNGEPSMEFRWDPRDDNYFIPVSEFANVIKQVPARKIVLVTGQCYGYNFGVKFRELLPDREVTVFSFAPPNERAYDTETEISLMFGTTYAKLPVLKDRQYDTNSDGHVSLSEAAKALEKRNSGNRPSVIGPDFYFPKKV